MKKTAFILGIPLVLCALLIMSAPFNGVVFTISEDNLYARCRNMSDIGFAVRYGGDEFIFITNQSEEVAKAAVVSIDKVLEDMNESGENEFKLAFSYGIATIGTDGNSDDLLNAMDSRMYEMKRARKVNR